MLVLLRVQVSILSSYLLLQLGQVLNMKDWTGNWEIGIKPCLVYQQYLKKQENFPKSTKMEESQSCNLHPQKK